MDPLNVLEQATKAFVFGEEFIDRVNPIKASLNKTVTDYIFVGPEDLRPEYAEPYTDLLASASADSTQVEVIFTQSFRLLQSGGNFNQDLIG